MFEILDSAPQNAVIKVVGVGGGGGNAVAHMIANNVEGVDFIAANTDAQALSNLEAKTTLQIGSGITRGLGAGARPELGREAALEDRERISEVLSGADMVFIAAGMGGGTGTGAAPIIAEVAKNMGILTVAVVTRPFRHEKRDVVAEQGIQELQHIVDSLITIPNQRLLDVLGRNVSMVEAFAKADDVLLGAVQGIADLIIQPGLVNVDFADVRTVMAQAGMAMMGTGRAAGEERARDATEAAIRSPLLDDVDLQGARGILVNVTAGADLSIGEHIEVGDLIEEISSDGATVVMGVVIDDEMGDELKVTVVATGLGQQAASVAAPNVVVDNTLTVQGEEMASDEELPPAALRGQVDYSDLDKPAFRRYPHTVGRGDNLAEDRDALNREEENLNYLDIPAFLRRQAD